MVRGKGRGRPRGTRAALDRKLDHHNGTMLELRAGYWSNAELGATFLGEDLALARASPLGAAPQFLAAVSSSAAVVTSALRCSSPWPMLQPGQRLDEAARASRASWGLRCVPGPVDARQDQVAAFRCGLLHLPHDASLIPLRSAPRWVWGGVCPSTWGALQSCGIGPSGAEADLSGRD